MGQGHEGLCISHLPTVTLPTSTHLLWLPGLASRASLGLGVKCWVPQECPLQAFSQLLPPPCPLATLRCLLQALSPGTCSPCLLPLFPVLGVLTEDRDPPPGASAAVSQTPAVNLLQGPMLVISLTHRSRSPLVSMGPFRKRKIDACVPSPTFHQKPSTPLRQRLRHPAALRALPLGLPRDVRGPAGCSADGLLRMSVPCTRCPGLTSVLQGDSGHCQTSFSASGVPGEGDLTASLCCIAECVELSACSPTWGNGVPGLIHPGAGRRPVQKEPQALGSTRSHLRRWPWPRACPAS